jgi:hypothetical protein
MLVELAAADLAHVRGGDVPLPPNPVNPQPGRCGPGDRWSWMNLRDGSPIVTPACIAHDAKVDGALMAGKSSLQAQWGARDQLWPAISSWWSRWRADHFGR